MGYTTEIDFEIKPLNHTTFSRTTLNALLKSVEEPPKNTTFIFLTKSKEDIIPTIVSRSVVFKLSSQKQNQNYNLISNIISKYPNIKFEDVYEISDEILKFLSDNQLKLEDFLNMFLLYLKDMLLANCSNDVFWNFAIKNYSDFICFIRFFGNYINISSKKFVKQIAF